MSGVSEFLRSYLTVVWFGLAAVLLAGLVALTLAAGPVTGWLAETARQLHDPAAFIAANKLGAP